MVKQSHMCMWKERERYICTNTHTHEKTNEPTNERSNACIDNLMWYIAYVSDVMEDVYNIKRSQYRTNDGVKGYFLNLIYYHSDECCFAYLRDIGRLSGPNVCGQQTEFEFISLYRREINKTADCSLQWQFSMFLEHFHEQRRIHSIWINISCPNAWKKIFTLKLQKAREFAIQTLFTCASFHSIERYAVWNAWFLQRFMSAFFCHLAFAFSYLWFCSFSLHNICIQFDSFITNESAHECESNWVVDENACLCLCLCLTDWLTGFFLLWLFCNSKHE